MSFQHYPVMSREVIEMIKDAKGSVVVDCTLGVGAHSFLILSEIKDIKIIGIDMDKDSIEIAKKNLNKFNDRVKFKNLNFIDIFKEEDIPWNEIGAIFVDSGISTYQLKSDEKGFSHSLESRLDMRKNKGLETDAFQIINHFSQKEIESILREYGEVKGAKALAKKIIERRLFTKIEKTTELREIVERFYNWKPRKGQTSPAAKVFQALRIYVNKEIEGIEEFITNCAEKMSKGSRIIFLTYHSIEDRIVKKEFLNLEKRGLAKIVKPFPMLPSDEEIRENLPSRSARLRCVEVA